MDGKRMARMEVLSMASSFCCDEKGNVCEEFVVNPCQDAKDYKPDLDIADGMTCKGGTGMLFGTKDITAAICDEEVEDDGKMKKKRVMMDEKASKCCGAGPHKCAPTIATT